VLTNFYCIVFSQSLVDYDDKPCLTFASDDEDEMENDIFSGKKYFGTLFGSLLCHQVLGFLFMSATVNHFFSF
jgi:hypothetical protein